MENMSLSDKSREALKSGTWEEIGEDLRKAIVREYLQTGHADGEKGHEIQVFGITYKVLDRGEVTTFYDSLGNTLFSVENKMLEQYGKRENEVVEPEESLKDEFPKDKAVEKLSKELKEAKDKSFADPLIKYLIKRCEEDAGMAEDVLQEHKTWEKCVAYIYEKARKQAEGNCVFIRDDVVYEWAEDYFRMDDKALEEQEKKRKEAAEKKRDGYGKQKKKAVPKSDAEEKNTVETGAKSDEPPKSKESRNKGPEGQMSLFDLL